MSAHLCLDFGTAYCKAATCTPEHPPVPLAIGKAVKQGRGDPHMIRTALFVSGSGRLFFGEAAVDRAARERRIPFDAIKDVLTSACDVRELDDNLPTEHNPATQPITRRQSIALFLAFFTQAALCARHAPRRKVARSIAVPVFAKGKTEWVSDVLAESLAQAHDLAKHFGDALFKSVELHEAIRVLNESKRRPNWRAVADPPTIAEPVAAVAAQLLHFTPTGLGGPGLMMVVDVGAGTTDIAMFAKGEVGGIVTVRHVKGSKRSRRVAGKAIDRALIEHMVSKSGRGDRLRAELQREGGGQPMKEEVFEDERVSRHGISTSLQDFLDSSEMRGVKSAIKESFDGVLREVDRSFFRHRTVVVRFSGGGASLPFLDTLVSPERLLRGMPKQEGTWVKMARAPKTPPWADERAYAHLHEKIGGKFHRMAVALGGAYYGAEGRSWLRLEDDMRSLGSRPEGPTQSADEGWHDDARPE